MTPTGICVAHAPKPWANHRGTSGAAWAKVRARVLERDGGLCACGAAATEVDHVIPRSVAPQLALEPDNCVAICRPCHQAKTAADRRRATT